MLIRPISPISFFWELNRKLNDELESSSDDDSEVPYRCTPPPPPQAHIDFIEEYVQDWFDEDIDVISDDDLSGETENFGDRSHRNIREMNIIAGSINLDLENPFPRPTYTPYNNTLRVKLDKELFIMRNGRTIDNLLLIYNQFPPDTIRYIFSILMIFF
jgi:hypothetical protein